MRTPTADYLLKTPGNVQAWTIILYRLPILYDGDVASMSGTSVVVARIEIDSWLSTDFERIDSMR